MFRRAIILRAIIALCGLIAVAAAVLCENALHIPAHMRPEPNPQLARSLAAETGSNWQDAQITASDSAVLKAWLFTPVRSNGGAVLALHGVADTRAGVLHLARLLVEHNYIVLAADSRGHGMSGGPYITYGILEAGDVHQWADWLFATRRPRTLYGIGESMGAAILLQSLRTEPRFRAIVAESSFATFREVAYDRLSQLSRIHIPPPLFWPLVEPAFLYARLRYGIDLGQASPLAAVRATKVPILLIHGANDTNIPPRHSRLLEAANPAVTRLWEVPHTEHIQAMATHPEEFAQRVLGWLESNSLNRR